jgi:membrane-associated phospholipid phosphatase
MAADAPAPPGRALLLRWPIGLLALILALALALSYTPANRLLFLAINGLAPLLPAALLLNITFCGNTLTALALISPWVSARPRLLWALLFAALPATLFSRGLKLLFERPRPAAELSPDLAHFVGPLYKALSFPSGHSTTAFVVAAGFCAFIERRVWRITALGLAVAVALSRVLVGAHWPADILAGAAGGWLCGMLGVVVSRRLVWTESRRGQWGAVIVLLGATVALAFMRPETSDQAALKWLLTVLMGSITLRDLRRLAAIPAKVGAGGTASGG